MLTELTRVIVVEEAVETRPVNINVVGIHDTQAPRVGTWYRSVRGIGVTDIGGEPELRVVQTRHIREGERGIGVWLIVRNLGLNEAHKYVLGVDELILVFRMVLDGRSETAMAVSMLFNQWATRKKTYSHTAPASLSINRPRPA